MTRVTLVTGGTRGIGAAISHALAEKVAASLRAAIPVRRMGRPDEVARVVAFLADDASGYITGQAWAVNGGLDM